MRGGIDRPDGPELLPVWGHEMPAQQHPQPHGQPGRFIPGDQAIGAAKGVGFVLPAPEALCFARGWGITQGGAGKGENFRDCLGRVGLDGVGPGCCVLRI